MKRILLLVAFLITTYVSMAQWSFQAQYNLWIPTSEYNSELKVGVLGAGVEARYEFSEYLSGTIGVGYALLPYKNVRVDRVKKPAEQVSDKAALQLIPITIGGNVYFNQDKFRPYLDLDFGVAMVQAKGDGMPDTEMKTNPFVSPGIGVEYELSDGLKVNGVVKQNVVIYNFDNREGFTSAFTAVGINLGISYKF
jgi:opacity protein-like surface antigen